jgi:hypothetical protein
VYFNDREDEYKCCRRAKLGTISCFIYCVRRKAIHDLYQRPARNPSPNSDGRGLKSSERPPAFLPQRRVDLQESLTPFSIVGRVYPKPVPSTGLESPISPLTTSAYKTTSRPTSRSAKTDFRSATASSGLISGRKSSGTCFCLTPQGFHGSVVPAA